MTRATLFGLIGWLALTLASPLVAQPFTYQGFLKQNGQPVNGTTSLTFRLYDAPTGGNQIGSAITQTVNVQNGLFTVELNFGTVWTGGDRYLEIQVGSTTLSPRVKITPAPYASFAASAGFAQRPWQSAGSNIYYNDGNVGIGTNSPAARLSLGGGNAYTKLAIWQGNTASEVMGLGVGQAQFRLHLNNANDRFAFLNGPDGSEVMTVRGDGNVGIGTTSPAERLHIVGNLRLDGEIRSLGRILLQPDTDNEGGPNDFGVAIGPPLTGIFPIGLSINMYNINGVALYARTADTPTGSPATIMAINSGGGRAGFFQSGGLSCVTITSGGGSYVGDWPGGWRGGLSTWDICASGIYASEYRTRSDIRLKRDIQPLDASSELQRLLSLRPVSYYWRDERLPQTMQYGFIAQELREVFPELVLESIDEQKTLSVNYQALIPLLVNALQAQQEQIRQQEARIQKLEAELQRLQGTSPK